MPLTVAFGVGDAVGVGVRVGVGVAVGVAAVCVGVGDAVGVGVGVAVGVGVGGAPFALPFNLTVALDLPLLALLVIGIESLKVPADDGANRTVTVTEALGARTVSPAPDVTENTWVEGCPTVTVSDAVPVSSTTKGFDSLVAVLPKVILLKLRLGGATFNWLNGVDFASG
ncbi:MAG TPA: hypothetical protein VEC38_03575 [Candidatus Binataceae bacterium]|nr:hypothetical protein [Candidatus Binataceae bacterium]